MRSILAFAAMTACAGCADATQPPIAGSSSDGGVVVLGSTDSGADAAVCSRRVFESDVINARDLAGWPVAGGQVGCRRIMRGGALTGLTAAGCGELQQMGLRSILDLREESAQTSSPPPACATDAAVHVSAATPKLLPDTPENYLALLAETTPIRQVFSVLSAAGSYPVYIHCEIGRDRASFVTALVLLALGADRQTVMDEFALSSQAQVPVKPECMSALLDEIAARGGIVTFLASAGVDAAAISVLRQQAIVGAQ
jgi:hypothetical protein